MLFLCAKSLIIFTKFYMEIFYRKLAQYLSTQCLLPCVRTLTFYVCSMIVCILFQILGVRQNLVTMFTVPNIYYYARSILWTFILKKFTRTNPRPYSHTDYMALTNSLVLYTKKTTLQYITVTVPNTVYKKILC